MPPDNAAAWLLRRGATPLEVGPAPYVRPGPGEIVIKNAAIAINPVDWTHQVSGLLIYLRYPSIIGNDVAGEVVEVGAGVERFKVGDRVLGQAAGTAPWSNKPSEGAFQHYTVLREYLVAPIPDSISYEHAVVLPMCLTTAAYGLFYKECLAMDFPTIPRPVPDSGEAREARAVIITAGASCVGSNAVQLAVAAGYRVYSTSSPRNFDMVKKLGATDVFDYRSPTLVDDLLAAVQGQTLAGAYAIGGVAAAAACEGVMLRHKNTSRKIIAFAGIPTSATSRWVIYGTLLSYLTRQAIKSMFTGITVRFIDSKDLHETNGVAGRTLRDFVPQALASGSYVPAPEPYVAGKGLGKIQEALDMQKRGVSAQKIVVSL